MGKKVLLFLNIAIVIRRAARAGSLLSNTPTRGCKANLIQRGECVGGGRVGEHRMKKHPKTHQARAAGLPHR